MLSRCLVMSIFSLQGSNIEQQILCAANAWSFIARLAQPLFGLLYSSCRSYAPRGGALLALLTPRHCSAYREGDRWAAIR
jgi:hypothetical protein